jgi:predicted outer membrane repeat protein
MRRDSFQLPSCARLVISKLLSFALLMFLSMYLATASASPLSAGAFVTQPAPLATVIEVNTTGEQCSRRAAIQRANALVGDEDIRFNIPATQPNCESATGNCTINLTKALPEVSTSVRIEGPGAAKLTVRRNTGGNYRIFTLGRPGGSATVSLSGLTVSNGFSPENGGGLFFYGNTLNVQSCVFSENTSEASGGGIHATGVLNVADSTFSGNNSKSASGGGGIHADGALTLTGSTFKDNLSTFFGGGIFANNSTAVDVRITDSTFERNRAQDGGALAVSSSVAQVTNCIIRHNTTTISSGGIYQTAGTLTVNYTMASGTATINSDYTNTFGMLTFESGQATKSFSIPIINDLSKEPDETTTLTLSSPTGGASLGSPSMAVLTIVDDDPQPSISIDDVIVAEGNSGTTNAGFTVKLSAPTFETVTVNYTTADDTATAGNDYQTASAALTFQSGRDYEDH